MLINVILTAIIRAFDMAAARGLIEIKKPFDIRVRETSSKRGWAIALIERNYTNVPAIVDELLSRNNITVKERKDK